MFSAVNARIWHLNECLENQLNPAMRESITAERDALWTAVYKLSKLATTPNNIN